MFPALLDCDHNCICPCMTDCDSCYPGVNGCHDNCYCDVINCHDNCYHDVIDCHNNCYRDVVAVA